MELLGDARIAGLPAQFGSDADMEKFEVIVEPDEEQSFEKPDEETHYPMKDLQEAKGNSNLHRNPMKDHSFGENTTSWAKYTPQMMRTPKSRNLVPTKSKMVLVVKSKDKLRLSQKYRNGQMLRLNWN
ncbi:hypothetical protein JTB14_017527 [Gonioctena quinquepunctata]|nr:hypothetical protein JTB14_017527 [Gonioctena quinquepunctata]